MQAGDLYFFLMVHGCDSHRFFIVPLLFESSLQNIWREQPCSTSSCSHWASVYSPCRSAMPTPATGCEEAPVIFDYSLAALVTAGLMIYLVYALLTPERF